MAKRTISVNIPGFKIYVPNDWKTLFEEAADKNSISLTVHELRPDVNSTVYFVKAYDGLDLMQFGVDYERATEKFERGIREKIVDQDRYK